jgi:hypothetical protein
MSSISQSGSIVRALASVAVVLGLLRLFPLSTLGPAAVAAGLIGLAWLVYRFLEPLCLLNRHAFLREVFNPGSTLRRWLWKGTWLRVLLLMGSLVTAALAFMTADALADYEWAFLLASLPVFGLALLVVRRRFGKQFVGRYEFTFSLALAYGISLALLVAAVVAWQIFKVEVNVTTHLAWHEVLTQAFALKTSEAVMPQVGWLLGLHAVASDGAWHLMQVARVEGDAGRWVYWGGCAILLAWSAMKLGSVWMVLLGAIMFACRSPEATTDSPSSALPRTVLVSVVVLALVVLPRLQMSDHLAGPNAGSQRASTEVERLAPDPCAELRSRQRREVSQRAFHELDRQDAELDSRMLALIDQRVDAAFAPAGEAVERFLDWNFSVEGQYQQLAHLAAAAASSRTFEGYIASQLDSHVHAVLDPALVEVGDATRFEMVRAIEAAYRRQDALVARLVAEASCLEVPKPTIRLEDYMRKSLVGVGAGAGIISTRLANRLGARMVSRAAVKRAMAAVVAKGATRTATTGKGALAGLACGPYAPFCIAGFAVVAWFGTDVVVNSIDEALHRDDMRAEMMGVLDAEKLAIKEQLRAAYLESAAQVFVELREYQAARFNIYRDGG